MKIFYNKLLTSLQISYTVLVKKIPPEKSGGTVKIIKLCLLNDHSAHT